MCLKQIGLRLFVTAVQKVLKITISFDVKTSTELMRFLSLYTSYCEYSFILLKNINLLVMLQNIWHLYHITFLKSEKF